jgi:hypothetical protein
MLACIWVALGNMHGWRFRAWTGVLSRSVPIRSLDDHECTLARDTTTKDLFFMTAWRHALTM